MNEELDTLSDIAIVCPFDGMPLEKTGKPWLNKHLDEEMQTVKCLFERHWMNVPIIDLQTEMTV